MEFYMKRDSVHDTTRKLAVAGALGAVTVLLGITRLGFIPRFSGAAITIMPVPVIIGAIIEGPVVGIAVGAIFGIFSLFQAAVAPTGVLDPFFVNPLISVLPRVLIGPAAYGIYVLLKKPSRIPAAVPPAVASFAGSIVNTVAVLAALVFAGAINWETFGVVFAANGFLEAAASAVIGTAVVLAWKNIGRRRQSRLNSEADDEK